MYIYYYYYHYYYYYYYYYCYNYYYYIHHIYIYGFIHIQNYHEQFTSIYPHCDSPRWTSERRPARGAPQMKEMIPSNAILRWFGFRKQQIFCIFRCAILEEMAGKWLETPMLRAGRCYKHLQIYHQNDPDAGKYFPFGPSLSSRCHPLSRAPRSAHGRGYFGRCRHTWDARWQTASWKTESYQVPSINNVETNMKPIIPGMGMNKLLIK